MEDKKEKRFAKIPPKKEKQKERKWILFSGWNDTFQPFLFWTYTDLFMVKGKAPQVIFFFWPITP